MVDRRKLLVEIGTEELPPKSLRRLGESFAGELASGLAKLSLGYGACRWFATPRRLAVMVEDLEAAQQDQQVTRRGPALAAAFDGEGKPTGAALGFARSCGVGVTELKTLDTEKGAWLTYTSLARGRATTELLEEVINGALGRLPIARRMRWGAGAAEFVRPAHWVVVLFGAEPVPCTVLGITSGKRTYGHRFHHPQAIELASADEYPARLRDPGCVIAGFDERRALVREQVQAAADALHGVAVLQEDEGGGLLDEVTALVEWPRAITGSFDPQFLELPVEVLRATMEVHQKYFPVFAPAGGDHDETRLLAHFIAIANIDSSDPGAIRRGNERVIRPRLRDAEFFWRRDCARPLADYRKGLDEVIYQQQLGTLGDKSNRLRQLAAYVAGLLGTDAAAASAAADLAKCDLLTDMVGEFPELQGTMGRYYALHAGVAGEIAAALEEQYLPRQAGGALPDTATGRVLAIADRLDTLVGIFAIGLGPTGEKDPFGLRRAALGCLRIMIEGGLDLDLGDCLAAAAGAYAGTIDAGAAAGAVFDFMMERLRRYYLDAGVRGDVFEAVLARRPLRPLDFNQRIAAVTAFARLPEADSLAAANKRIVNILRQAGGGDPDSIPPNADGFLLTETVERDLHARLIDIAGRIAPLVAARDYTEAMRELSRLREPVDAFFDRVMVMVEDEALRGSRLQLLAQIRSEFQQIADISRLQGVAAE